MIKIKEKNKALELRRKGKSINEIACKLNIPKSTVSVWCRNIKLGLKQIKRLEKRQESGSYKGRMKFLEKIRKIRIQETIKLREQGIKEIGKLNKREFFIGGTGMYWSEGETCSTSDNVCFTNSDPKMILFMIRWFKEIGNVPGDKFSLQIRINKSHKNRTKKIENNWSKITGIPLAQFTKTILINTKIKKNYPNADTYLGTLRILVHQGTKLRRKINGWIEGLVRNI